jgi:hypothetical protein
VSGARPGQRQPGAAGAGRGEAGRALKKLQRRAVKKLWWWAEDFARGRAGWCQLGAARARQGQASRALKKLRLWVLKKLRHGRGVRSEEPGRRRARKNEKTEWFRRG